MIELHEYDVAVLGNWHLAFTSAAVLSHVGRRVLLVNPEGSPVAEVGKLPPPPVQEPGLPEMIEACFLESRLGYTRSFLGWKAQAIWLAIDTPVNDLDEPDVAPLLQALQACFKNHSEVSLLIVSSQVPIGFCRSLQEQFKVPVAVVPENLRLGKGIDTFLNADRTVVGADSETTWRLVQKMMMGFRTEFLFCGIETAEMTKHANNAFLATSISFANELARIGERYGVESQIVAQALKLDKRIGPAAYVAPGLGFAGGTLPRDLRVLQKKGQEKDIPTPLLNAVLHVNQETTTAIAEIVMDRVGRLERVPEVLVLGYTYKADTNTLRRSLSLDIARILRVKGCRVWGHDPFMNSQDLSQLDGVIQHCRNWDELPIRPDVILVMTARPDFKELNWQKVHLGKESAPLLIDTQNWIAREKVLAAGIDFKALWSPLVRSA